MPAYVRVRDKQTGHEYTVPSARFNDEAHVLLDKPALSAHGTPRGVTYRRDIDAAATVRKPRRPAAKKATAPAPIAELGTEPTTDGQTADSEEGDN